MTRLVIAVISAVLSVLAGGYMSSEPATVLLVPQASLTDMTTSIRAALDEPTPGTVAAEERSMLRALYQPGGFLPLWLDARMAVNADARESIALLGRAAEDGLDPLDYRVDQLRVQTGRITTLTGPRDLAAVDVALSRSMLRYLHDLRVGRVNADTLRIKSYVTTPPPDYAAILRAALSTHRIGDVINEQRPPMVEYQAMRTMLTRYRSLADDRSLEPPALSDVVKPGQPYAGRRLLHRWLAALGDMPEATSPSGAITLDAALVDGVKRFQVRHGLEPDGVLGRQTQEALRVPLTWRVRQIELALERLRWWPRDRNQRLVIVNIAMFRLWAWDAGPPDAPPMLTAAVIVGRARKTQTPSLVGTMREVIFRPYWNVPASILRNEILPTLRRNPSYLTEQDMEIVGGPGDDAQSVEVTAGTLDLLRQGTLRLRQRPGPRNALGLVKFVFPNDENVYLHATPARSLFQRSRRDFSHGCVRVEDAIGLAEWVLKDRPEWTRERILEAMNGTRSLPVQVEPPIRVALFYMTAAIMPDDRSIHFTDDIYGADDRLDNALTDRTRSIGVSLGGTPPAQW